MVDEAAQRDRPRRVFRPDEPTRGSISAYLVRFALPGFSSADWGAMGIVVWAAVAYSTALVAAIGFFDWQREASRLGANTMLVYQYLITLVGVFSGVMLLGEGLGVQKLVGGAIILVGVYLAWRQ